MAALTNSVNEGLELKLGEEQIAHMRVSTQIIEHLSKGIYTNPARSIKELITNSFDADATLVTVRARPELDSLSVEDNGIGMNYEDFSRNFLFISRSDKRDEGLISPIYKRPLIGKIGIGFIAVSQICDEMMLISSKYGEPFRIEASIDFAKFRKTEHRKKDFYDLSEVKLKNLPEEKNVQYTIIILKKLTDGFRDQLLDKDMTKAGIKPLPLEGLTFEKVFDRIKDKAIGSESQFDLSKHIGRYWQILLEIANSVPVAYMDKGPVILNKVGGSSERSFSIIERLKAEVAALNFTVDFDGIILKKPILFPIDPAIKKIGEDFDVFEFADTTPFADGTQLSFSGYIYNQKYSIYPPQFRGVIIRIKNTAIGGPDPGFLEYLYGDKLFFNWTFGEVYVSDGLEDAMNINRSSFITTHEHYQSLRSYLHDLLHTEVFPKARERYETRLNEQRLEKDKTRKSRLLKIFEKTFGKPFQIIWVENRFKPPVTLDSEKGLLIINRSNPVFDQLKESDKPLLEDILLYLYIAHHFSKGNADDMLDRFLRSLQEWKV